MNTPSKPAPGLTAIVTAYFLIYVVWGSTYYFIGVALQGFPTFLLGALRFSMAGLLLLALCRARGERVFRRTLVARSAVSGIVLLFVDMAVIMLAQRYVSSSVVAIVASSTALWMLLLDAPQWRRNFRSPTKLAALLAGFLGVGLLYVEQLKGESTGMPHSEYGILILVGGCISWAAGSLYAKYRSSAAETPQCFGGSAWQMLAAGAMFWLCSFATGERFDPDAVPWEAWGSLAYLILFGSLLAYSAYIWLLKVRPATEVATHAYVNPVVAVALGAGLGGESVSLVQIGGLCLILLSVMLVNRRRKPHEG